MNEPKPQPEQNPYEATQVAEMATSVTDRQKPGTVAVAFSVVLGLAVAVIAFGVSFFATCVGLDGIGAVDVDSASGTAFLLLVGHTSGEMTRPSAPHPYSPLAQQHT